MSRKGEWYRGHREKDTLNGTPSSMKSLRFSTLTLFAFIAFFAPVVFAQAPTVTIEVFVRADCIHCNAEKAFLAELKTQRNDLTIIFHDIADNAGRTLFDQVTAKANLPKATPITYVNGDIVQGFGTPETTGKYILGLLERAQGKPVFSLADYLASDAPKEEVRRDEGCDETGATPCTVGDTGEYLVNVPFMGAVDMKQFSIPAIAAILGFVDGFNPCAMWVLVTFLLVLMQIGDRRKVWQIAGLFIAAETVMYYLILNVWYTAWDFIGLDQIITPLVGLVAVGAGCYFLYEGYKSDGTCQVTSSEQKRKTSLRISDIASRPFTIVSAIAVIGLALSVNVIEFACSIGIPQTFTKILDLNNLDVVGRQAMMLIYILMYMVDDFIVFGLALWGAQYLNLTTKYSKWCNLLGGALMLLLGSLLIFAPQALRFG